jgi:hypothetical protein
LISTGVLAVLAAVQSDEAFAAWGWRIPFLLSAVLILVGLWVRLAVSESPVFLEAQRAAEAKAAETGAVEKAPIITVLTRYKREVLVAMGAGAVGVGVWGFAFFTLLDSRSFVLAVVAITVGLLFHGAMYGPQAAFLSEWFGTKARCSGVSVGYQLASVVAGAPAPLIAVALLGSFTDPSATAVAVYLAVCAVITLVAVLSYGETRTRDLAADKALVVRENRSRTSV